MAKREVTMQVYDHTDAARSPMMGYVRLSLIYKGQMMYWQVVDTSKGIPCS